MKYRVGIIGTGFGAKVHAPMMRFHEGFDVVAIASVSRGNIEEVKEISGVENVYLDWKTMLAEETLDVLVIASAVHLHKEMVLATYEKGIHVVCEKPMALDSKETLEMIEAKEKVGKLGIINHEFRFLPARLKVKELLASSSIGDVLHVRYQCTFPSYTSLSTKARGWLGNADTGGGMLGAIGSHMIDTLQWWLGCTFAEVQAHLPIHIPSITTEDGTIENRTADDGFQVLGQLENRATVTLELLSAARQTMNTWRLEVYGTKGSLVMVDDQDVFLALGDNGYEQMELLPNLNVPEEMPAIAARYYNGFQRALDALYETLESGEHHTNIATFENGHATQRILDAVRKSSKEGTRVTISN